MSHSLLLSKRKGPEDLFCQRKVNLGVRRHGLDLVGMGDQCSQLGAGDLAAQDSGVQLSREANGQANSGTRCFGGGYSDSFLGSGHGEISF